MANKKKSGDPVPDQMEQPVTPPEAKASKTFTIEQLRREKGISQAVFAGVCAAQSWKPGKSVTEAEFLNAVKEFTSAPMSGTAKKEMTK